ncbi:COG4648 family protein [Basilea psittacipulmonis]|uniref:DNA gyrase subunit B n=1 Tax=Basilea psittacipulmonis DSM 24701 TaxID=1072685 RepID=A0A077DIG8_9BURK|nr:hypothetical protein [Basilea psittacipulmonis]AIL33262.1 hypothetical protein IX83_08095 [Basilea psittacipulmonis DSM 24701]
MKKIINGLLIIIMIAYPFILYFNHSPLTRRAFFLVLACLYLSKFIVALPEKPYRNLVLAGFFFLIFAFNLSALAYWYPIIISSLLLIIFAQSLWSEQTVIEKIARFRHPDLPPEAVHYTRQVTKVWIGFFLFNILITAILLHTHLTWWTLYTGVIAYILMGILFIGEWLYRKYIIKV